MGSLCNKTIPQNTIIPTNQTKSETEKTKDDEIIQTQSTVPAKRILKREGTTTSFTDIRNVYKFDYKIIGSGHFGTVRLAYIPSTPSKKYAVKTIFKEKIKKDLHLLKRELEILKTLDHPNIVKFYETYQDDKFFHLVMEYCSGGELLERIVSKQSLQEKEAVDIMKKIFSAVNYLHEHGIGHRDLKPENFLFSHKGEDAEIKIIDFGLSKQIEENSGGSIKGLQTLVGTALYVAPEVLVGNYDYRCDNWSVGVIAYILLSGNPPFLGATAKDVFEKIKKGKFSLSGGEWKRISKQAKDFIQKLICVDVNKRMTADQALKHEWLNMNINATDKKINKNILNLLKNFRGASTLKREAMKIIVNLLNESEIKNLRDIFRSIDKQNKGLISHQDLKKVMLNMGYSENEWMNLANTTHLDADTKINYSDFIAAMLDKKKYLNQERLMIAFKHFDVDNSNVITVNNLKESMARGGRKLSNTVLEDWIKEIDVKNSGAINFEEFQELMINEQITRKKISISHHEEEFFGKKMAESIMVKKKESFEEIENNKDNEEIDNNPSLDNDKIEKKLEENKNNNKSTFSKSKKTDSKIEIGENTNKKD